MVEITFAMIKPDATKRNLVGKILSRYEEEGLTIVGMKMKKLARAEATGFYYEHRERSFFEELITFICSHPVVMIALKGEEAIKRNRDIMGATDPKNAAAGTIRKLFAKSIGENSIHGSDSKEAAQRELTYFFPSIELFN